MKKQKKPVVSLEHTARFEELVIMDGTAVWDTERRALFFVLAGNDELYTAADKIYDFRRHMLKGAAFHGRDYLSSGTEKLLKIGINLYNGHSFRYMDPFSVMVSLDSRNRRLAMEAVRLRFNC